MSTVMFGMVGLAVDAGRLIIHRNEVQNFVDAAATAAAAKLDGTRQGVEAANVLATEGPAGSSSPNRWNFNSAAVPTVTATYATSFAGTYQSYATASTGSTNTYRFVRVTAQGPVPLYFIGVIPGAGTQRSVAATAIAGQQPQSTGSSNIVPMSPDAHDASDLRHFGLTPGARHTLKWGNNNVTDCAGDAGFDPNNAPSQHGFVDLGQGNGNSDLRNVIVYGGYPSTPLVPGDAVGGVPGNRGASIFAATAERSLQDPDQTSTTWAEYVSAGIGNGRRVITAPINDPTLATGNGNNRQVTIVGFGSFLLDRGATISGSSGPLCATYIGPASTSGGSSGGTDGTKIYSVVLYK